MKNESLFLSISQQAKESIEEAADRAGAGMKRTKGRVEIVTFQLDGVVRKGEWPPAGKITTCIFERLKGDAPLLCIGHKENSLIMRLNDAAVALGLSANDLAKGIVKSMPDFVIGGGGHAKAGAIRVKPGFAKDVLGELMRRARGE
jgi:RecJ-like exonuclease